ncbi:DEAD/DEAH box helicase family protein [Cryptosporidium meleagridis]|uniref:RNA helicase n=1 Tax=Cryptosporidium meleagridis TaxID=93969 RepID=A0A2P4Z1M4_9CRYT|nr:DEAD/DEAH box helicase family protein [Cryptosporidium meleagridis]
MSEKEIGTRDQQQNVERRKDGAYIPPHRRQQGLREDSNFNLASFSGNQANSYNGQRNNSSRNNIDGKRNDQASNLGFRKHNNSFNESNITVDRFSALGERQSNPSNSKYQYNAVTGGNNDRFGNLNEKPQERGYNKYYRNRIGVSGTGWDVRDGRSLYRDDEDKIFSKSKEHRAGINFDAYDNIPVEMTGSDTNKIKPMQSFMELEGIHEILLDNIRRVKYERPTPVQKFSIPTVLNGRDLMACAQTGSGKTAAFLFPIVMKMLNDGPPPTPQQSSLRIKRMAYPVALVLSPTRELAIQTYEESRKFCFGTGIRTNVLYGGSEVRSQIMDLDRGSDIIVATPGRLRDLIDRGKVNLKLIKFLILDEADRMLDMGFAPQIREIVEDSDMPHSLDGRQTVMFSATFPREIQQLAKDFLHNYIFLTVGRVGATSGSIVQRVVYAEEDHKPRLLVKLLLEQGEGLTVVFVEMKRRADQIEDFLIDQNFPAVSIHGDRSQQEREHALRLFRSGQRPILVATDVAARGLDIPNITHVINLDMPCNIDDYVHRIGRTGRAGNTGLATSFVNESNKPILRDLLAALEESGQDAPEWFQDMVKSCTASFGRYGNRFNKGGVSGSQRGNRGLHSFGSVDIRSNQGGSNCNSVNSNYGYSGNNSSSGNQGSNNEQWKNRKGSGNHSYNGVTGNGNNASHFKVSNRDFDHDDAW